MAKSDPVHAASTRPAALPSRSGDATPPTLAVAASASAERYAAKVGIALGQAAALRPDCSEGDLVSLEAGGVRHDFYILRRRWIVADGTARLEVTLDHPVRGARRG